MRFAPTRIAAVSGGHHRSAAHAPRASTSRTAPISNGIGSASFAMPLIDGSSGVRATPANACIAHGVECAAARARRARRTTR